MPISVPLRVSMSGGEKGKSRAREEVSNVRHSPTALRASGSAESIPSRWRKASGSSLPRVAAKWAFARCVISFRESASLAWRVTDREEWKRRSRPRCTSSRRRVTSSRAISASGDIVRPRRRDKLLGRLEAQPSATPTCGRPARPVSGRGGRRGPWGLRRP